MINQIKKIFKIMTTQLATLLVKDYEEAIKEVKDSQKDVSGIMADLHKGDITCGICRLIKKKHRVYFYMDDWILSIKWSKQPLDCKTKEEILKSLNFRLTKLKKFLKS